MKRILVAAAVIRREGKILIAQRPADKHQGGLWEFPGGKVEEGEPVERALVRELEEELGITPTVFRPLIRITHDYPDKSVCLDVWEISGFLGEAHGREGQPVSWVSPEELLNHDFPAANRPIVTAARLPSFYHITPDGLSAEAYIAWLEERLQQDASLILFRAPHLARERYLAIAQMLLERCRKAGALLMLHGDPALLNDVAATGVHMPAQILKQLSGRPVERKFWLAASVHDDAELRKAESMGVDFVTLSPVQVTLSHPEAMALGWEKFGAIAVSALIPVYALGGMRKEDFERAWRAGAQGVAGIRNF